MAYFDDNPHAYWRSIRLFEIYVESEFVTSDRRLFYPSHCCKDAAGRAIEVCLMLSPNVAYHKALGCLQELFGQPNITARSLKNDVMRQVSTFNDEGSSPWELAIRMRSCHLALTQMNYLMQPSQPTTEPRASQPQRVSQSSIGKHVQSLD